jgi:predicted restriction endonuclease
MRRPVADDVIAVLEEIRHRFELSGSEPDVQDLRKEAIQVIARIEVDARRFANEVSADNSIHDACVRRLGYTQVAEFDAAVNDWLRGRSDALSVAVLARVTTEGQRQKLAEVLGISDSQPTTPPAQDLESPPAERVETTVSRILRDTQLSNRVKALHNYECQLCGCTLPLADGSRYAEGHHVQPLGAPHNGPDVLESIICVCPNHHAACDLGAIELVRHELQRAVGHVVDQRYVDYHNSKIYGGSNRAEQSAAPDRGHVAVRKKRERTCSSRGE